jgi:hypothetical protein
MKKFAIAGIAALSIAASTAVYAQHHHWGFGHMRMNPEDRVAFLDARVAAVRAGLKLNADQGETAKYKAEVDGLSSASRRAGWRRPRRRRPGSRPPRCRKRGWRAHPARKRIAATNQASAAKYASAVNGLPLETMKLTGISRVPTIARLKANLPLLFCVEVTDLAKIAPAPISSTP